MKVPWANPWLGEDEKKELIAAFDSSWLSMGQRTAAFEDKMQDYIGVKHAIAVANGTVALDLALKALGAGPQDEVIVPAMTYIATISAVLYQQAIPVFADIERQTFNIDPLSIKKLISKRTKCIIYIDYGGNPADHESLARISQEYGIPLLQDGAQSLGAEFNSERLCKQGRIATASFHIAKPITTVEGGMIFTQDDSIAAKLRMMRNQGEDPQRKYIHLLLGTNARMTDLQAAIGLRQLEKIEAILKKRNSVGNAYYAAFKGNKKIKLPQIREGARNAWFFAPILVENRDAVALELKNEGIDTRVAYPLPVYEQPFFKSYRNKSQSYDCPNARWMTERVLDLPLFHGITGEQINYVIQRLSQAVEEK
jgi:perosamine synthetase